MLSADELRELRSLQARAYGRDSGISDADARRLRELEQQRMTTSSVDQGPSPLLARSTDTDDDDLVTRIPEEVRSPRRIQEQYPDEAAAHPESDAPIDAEIPTTDDASIRGVLRRLWRPLAAASAVLLVFGLAAGWAIFGQRTNGIALTDEQVQRRLELYEQGKYDEGSLRAVGQKNDALVWYATRSDGEFVCIILDVGDQSANSCQVEKAVREGTISTNVMSAAADPDTGEESHVGAFLLYSTTGEPVAAIQQWTASPDETWLDQFEAEERDRAEALLEAGFEEGSMSIVGYLRDEAVWVATRQVDQGTTESCMIVGGADDPAGCTNMMSAFEEGLSATVIVDGSTWALDVHYTKWQTPYLTITGGADEEFIVAPGDRVEVGGEHGDPIEIGTDAPQG
ncbi:hypothetical protein [Microbacterium aurantiacum]|uniref:hypothetical protein n=1 Tax=Microbacterium aurantiacum TaxID=162393 RepID=UPI000C7FBC5E|nr:hypothetical protein [Microbacterium aurantiacum]